MTQGRPVALITGAATGIGRAAAVALAAAGYRRGDQLQPQRSRRRAKRQRSPRPKARRLCSSNATSATTPRSAKCSPPSNQEFGRLDALVNNAGTTSNVKPSDFEAMTAEEWDRVFAVNVRGMFQVTRAAAPLLKAARGSVVNTASIVGLRPGPQPLPYAASKAAVVSLTKLLALNLAPDVRVNAVAPGWMEGDWMQRMLADRYDDLMARRAKSTPLRRCATAEDVAEVIVNLITSNRFVNGEIIVIDGGYSATT